MTSRIRDKILRVNRKIFPITVRELNRTLLGQIYIKGKGIEIGALYNPMRVNPQIAKVCYVDRMKIEDLRKQYPELEDYDLVPVDIIANGETLETIQDATQDFVIANHFLEHCQDPILTVKNMLRVLKPGGIIFLTVPDKRFTFDKRRAVTSIGHLLKDHNEGVQSSKTQHFFEWARFICGIENEQELEMKVQELMAMDYSIHFHVWEKKGMDEFLSFLNASMNFNFEIQLSMQNEQENVYLLKKL